MKSLSLYDMTKEMMSLLEADDIDGDLIEQAFGNIAAKDSKICYFIRDLELAADARKVEEKRLADSRKALENKVKSLKSYIQTSMDMMDVDKIAAGVFTLSVQNNPAALETVNADLCPAKYLIQIPERWEPDTARIKDVLKTGEEVPGFALKVGRSLRIR